MSGWESSRSFPSDKSPMVVRYPRFWAPLRDAARFRARSTSHSVAVRDGGTNIPLAASRAQEDENLSRNRFFRPRLASVRPPGSVRADSLILSRGLRYWMKTGLSSGRPNHCAFDHDSSAHIFPERDQQLSRQRHDRRLSPTTAVAFDSVLEPESEYRGRLMAYPKPGELNHRCP